MKRLRAYGLIEIILKVDHRGSARGRGFHVDRWLAHQAPRTRVARRRPVVLDANVVFKLMNPTGSFGVCGPWT